MAKRRHPYIIKHNKLKLVAFKARIDKSKAVRRVTRTSEDDHDVSPYFVKPLAQQKPLTCSLLPHEAEAYCYKLPSQQQETRSHPSCALNEHGGLKKLPLLYNLSADRSKPRPSTTMRGICDKEKELSQSSSLNLDRSLLKATRISVTNACKQYPPVLSRNVLDKYAHLFGLGGNVKRNTIQSACEEAILVEEQVRGGSRFEQIRHRKIKRKRDP